MSSRASKYNEKRAKAAEAAIERELDTGADRIDFDGLLKQDTKDAAMGSKSTRSCCMFDFLSCLFSEHCLNMMPPFVIF